MEQTNTQIPNKPKKSKKGLFVGLGVGCGVFAIGGFLLTVILVIAIVIGAIFLFKRNDRPNPTTPNTENNVVDIRPWEDPLYNLHNYEDPFEVEERDEEYLNLHMAQYEIDLEPKDYMTGRETLYLSKVIVSDSTLYMTAEVKGCMMENVYLVLHGTYDDDNNPIRLTGIIKNETPVYAIPFSKGLIREDGSITIDVYRWNPETEEGDFLQSMTLDRNDVIQITEDEEFTMLRLANWFYGYKELMENDLYGMRIRDGKFYVNNEQVSTVLEAERILAPLQEDLRKEENLKSMLCDTWLNADTNGDGTIDATILTLKEDGSFLLRSEEWIPDTFGERSYMGTNYRVDSFEEMEGLYYRTGEMLELHTPEGVLRFNVSVTYGYLLLTTVDAGFNQTLSFTSFAY